MKRFKKLGILLGVLAAVCAATLILTGYEQKQEQIKISDSLILEIPMDTVKALSWEYAGDTPLAFHRGEEGWLYDEDENFPVSEKAVKNILSHFEAFGVTFVIENVEDYSQYGLDTPECTLTVSTEEKEHTMKLGNFSTMDQQRYIDIGDGNVYLVGQDPIEYVSAELSDMVLHDETPDLESVVDIRFTGSENYIIQHMENTQYSYSESDVYFTQENGTFLPLDTNTVTQYLNTISTLDLLDYVTYNATQEELAACGLDEPELSITVNYTCTEEDSEEPVSKACTLHISRDPEALAAAETEESQEEEAPEPIPAYVRIGESQLVYNLDPMDYEILSAAAYNDLRHQEVFWGDFDTVEKIDITLEGKDHTLISERNEDEEQLWYYLDEDTAAVSSAETTQPTQAEEAEDTLEDEPETLELTDFTDALNALSANSFTAEAPTGPEEIRFTLHLQNEAFPTLEIALYRHSGTECLVTVDARSVSLVPRSSAMAVVEALQAIILNNT